MNKDELVQYVLNNCNCIKTRAEAVNLICDILNITLTEFTLSEDIKIDELKIQNIILKLNSGEPLAKILSFANFCGLNFYVDTNVLTPRQDSEVLVMLASEYIKQNETENFKVLDMCCGSGCLGLSIKHFNPKIELTLADISADALKVAKKNANELKLDTEVIFSDLFSNVNDKYNLIISNPPYIKTDDLGGLEKQVVEFDPIIALDGRDDGLFYYREIAKCLVKFLCDGGAFICEFGFDQANDIKEIFDKLFLDVKIYKDNGGNDRVAVCKNLKV